MSVLQLIRAAQSENVTSGSMVELVRACPCGAKWKVSAAGEGVAGATPSGFLMSASDMASAWQSALGSATRNARRNAVWSRCKACGRRGRGAHVFAALTKLLVVFPAAIFGAITGCIVGMVRGTIDPNSMTSTAVLWAAGCAVPLWFFATWRRLKLSDSSAELEPHV